MALLEDLVCKECGKPFKGVRTRNYGELCTQCADAAEEKEKQRWLTEWRGGNDLEQRVEKIEEWLFEHSEGEKGHYYPRGSILDDQIG
jgi:hypothetical protein